MMEKDPSYYVVKILLNLCLLAFGLGLIIAFRGTWIQIFSSALLAFTFTQVGFVVHDAGHQQIFSSARKNRVVSLIHANLLLGFSCTWWMNTHNQHHRSPNQLDMDPDIDFVVLAFSEDQARKKRGIARYIVKHQAYFFFPLLLVEAFSLKFESVRFLIRSKVAHPVIEWICLLLHHAVLLGLLVKFLGAFHAILFTILNHAIFGVFLGLVFVTNHKGMPLLHRDCRLDFLERQVITARNIRGSNLVDYLYGGLSCQIEHHLFPNIPLSRLRKAQGIVRGYCESVGLSYYETGVFRAYREVLSHLHEVGAPLRAGSL
jgi:fatty acid desaturase